MQALSVNAISIFFVIVYESYALRAAGVHHNSIVAAHLVLDDMALLFESIFRFAKCVVI